MNGIQQEHLVAKSSAQPTQMTERYSHLSPMVYTTHIQSSPPALYMAMLLQDAISGAAADFEARP